MFRRTVWLRHCWPLASSLRAPWAQSSSGTITRTGPGSDRPDRAGRNTHADQNRYARRPHIYDAATGDFVFTALQPGPYSLKVQASGFKLVEKTDLNLSASERLAAGDISLQVGSLTETISVTAEAATGADGEFGTRRADRLQPGQQADHPRARRIRPAGHASRRGL